MKSPLPAIGLLGGTFDPVHQGHLDLAQHALKALQLDRVLFVPAAQNPLKPAAATAGAQQRVQMLQLALEERQDPALSIEDLETRRPGPSYAVDTLEELAAREPARWVWILGSEVFRTLPRWKSPEKILALAEMAVITRPGESPANIEAVLSEIPPGKRLAIHFLEHPTFGVSSTEIRHKLESLSPLERRSDLPPLPGLQRSVWLFIKENRLYSR